jgi:hypothetical protein
MSAYILFAGALANILGTFPYIRNTIRGTTKPNRVTWLFWSLGTFVAFFAALSGGAGWAAFPVFISASLCLITFVVAVFNKNAYWRLGLFDYLCGGFALCALILWMSVHEPVLALAFAIISDVFASLPTLIKSWTHPESESSGTYVGGLCNGLAAFFVPQPWTFSSIGFPAYVAAQEIIILVALYKKKLLS